MRLILVPTLVVCFAEYAVNHTNDDTRSDAPNIGIPAGQTDAQSGTGKATKA